MVGLLLLLVASSVATVVGGYVVPWPTDGHQGGLHPPMQQQQRHHHHVGWGGAIAALVAVPPLSPTLRSPQTRLRDPLMFSLANGIIKILNHNDCGWKQKQVDAITNIH